MNTTPFRRIIAILGLVLLVLLVYLGYRFLPFGGHQRIDRAPVADLAPIAELIARDQCEPAYRQLLRLDPASLEPAQRTHRQLQLALCERALGYPEQALTRLEQLSGIPPLLADYHRFWIARSLEDMGETASAIAAYQSFLHTCRHPELNDQARLRLADLGAATAAYDLALELYQQLLAGEAAPEPEIFYRIGRTHQQRGAPAEARRIWLQLAEKHPGSPQSLAAIDSLPVAGDPQELYLRAQVRAAHQQHLQAGRHLERFLRAYPGHPLTEEVRYALGKAQAAQGQYERAQQIFAALFAQYQRPSALYSIGGLQVRRDQEQEAIATYERFVRLFPGHDLADEALWQAAKAAERGDHFDLAGKFYRRLADHYPESDHRDEAGWSIGFMNYCRKEYQKALAVFQELSQTAREPYIVDQSLFWAGKTAERLGQTDAARACYRQAARNFPRSYYSARAVALGYRETTSIAPRPAPGLRSSPETETQPIRGAEYLERAALLHQLGLADLARRELQAAERRNRDHPDALRLIRDRYETFGMLDSALRLSAFLFVSDNDQGEIRHLYPNYYWDQILQAAQEAAVDPYLVLSVIRQESSFREDAVSPVGALGLMQIMPQTGLTLARRLGMDRFEHYSLLDPEVSIRLGSHFLGDQVRQFAAALVPEMGFELGLAAYNAGPDNARRWLERIPHEDPDAFVERIPYHEIRQYVKLVMKNYTIYKALSDA